MNRDRDADPVRVPYAPSMAEKKTRKREDFSQAMHRVMESTVERSEREPDEKPDDPAEKSEDRPSN